MKRLLYICLAALLTAVSCDKTPEEVAAAITPTGDAAALFTNGLKVAASASTTKVTFVATRDWSLLSARRCSNNDYANWLVMFVSILLILLNIMPVCLMTSHWLTCHIRRSLRCWSTITTG